MGMQFFNDVTHVRWTCEAVGAWTDCRGVHKGGISVAVRLSVVVVLKNSKSIIITLLKSRLLPRAHERSQTHSVRVVHLHRAELDLIQTQPNLGPFRGDDLRASGTCDDAKYNLRRSQTSPRALTSPSVPNKCLSTVAVRCNADVKFSKIKCGKTSLRVRCLDP